MVVTLANALSGTEPARTRSPDEPVSKSVSSGLPPTRTGSVKLMVPFEEIPTLSATFTGPPASNPLASPAA